MDEIPWRWPRRRPGAPLTVLAHRGGSGPWRENTLEAFAAALAAGADGVELDVRRSADAVLVVHHDAEVPGSGLVHECRYDSLPSWVPTLGEALATCAGSVVNVEIKNVPTDPGYDPSNRVSTDVAALLRHGAGPGEPWPAHVIVSSFWPETLGPLNDGVAPGDDQVALGLLVHPALAAVSMLDTAAGLGCAALHPHHSQVNAELVGRAHGLGLAVAAWTVNRPNEIDAVFGAGADVVITDSVGDTLTHLGRR